MFLLNEVKSNAFDEVFRLKVNRAKVNRLVNVQHMRREDCYASFINRAGSYSGVC